MRRLPFLVVLALLLIALGGPPVRADEDDPATGGTADWSPPEGVPAGDVPEEGMPAPRVRDGDAGTAPTATDPFADEPGARPGDGTGTRTDGTGEAPRLRPRPTQTSVVEIKKTHNVQWRSQGYALQLDIDFQVMGQAGRFIGARVDFYDKKSGRPIRSILYPFANRDGQASVWTKLVKLCWNSGSLRSTLHMPYRAFPCPGPNAGSYEIEAQVRLQRWEARGRVSDLAVDSTTFTIHSALEEGQTAPKRPTTTVARRGRIPKAPDQAGNWVWCLPRNNCFLRQAAEWSGGGVSDAGCRAEDHQEGL